MGLPPEFEKIVAQEDREMGPHQEETEIVDLGTGNGKKEVKISTGMTAPIWRATCIGIPTTMTLLEAYAFH